MTAMTTNDATHTLRVAVGSTNAAKVGAVRAVFARIRPHVEIRPVPVETPPEIGEMPVGDQVKGGAIYRAREAFATGDEFAVGLEGGVEFEGESCYLFNWAAVLHRDGRISTAPSAKLLLPDDMGRAIRAGKVLGDLMIERVGKTGVNAKEGAVGYLTSGLISRERFFEDCLILALAPYLRPDAYGGPATSLV